MGVMVQSKVARFYGSRCTLVSTCITHIQGVSIKITWCFIIIFIITRNSYSNTINATIHSGVFVHVSRVSLQILFTFLSSVFTILKGKFSAPNINGYQKRKQFTVHTCTFAALFVILLFAHRSAITQAKISIMVTMHAAPAFAAVTSSDAKTFNTSNTSKYQSTKRFTI